MGVNEERQRTTKNPKLQEHAYASAEKEKRQLSVLVLDMKSIEVLKVTH